MKKVFLNLFFIIACLIVIAMPAAAQEEASPASSGTLITSVMEQVGYHAQSQVLTQLGESLEWLSSLIYLGVLVSILLTVGLMGNYKAALWILVGPPMFVYVSGVQLGGQKNTIKGAGVEWRFGSFKDKQVNNDQARMLNESEVGKKTPAEVSLVFHKYNELISELFQYLIAVITSNDTRSQMMFMTRQRIQESLFDDRVNVPGLISLGQHFMTYCSREIAYAAYLAEGLRDPAKRNDPYWETAKGEYCRLFVEQKAFPTGPWQDYLFSEQIYKGLHISKEKNEGPARRQEDGIASCQLLWEGMMYGAKEGVLDQLEELQETAVAPQAWKVSGAKTYTDALKAIRKKLTEEDEKVTLEKKNRESVNCVAGQADPANINSDVRVLSTLIAAFVVKKVIVTTPYADVLTRVNDRDHGILSDQTIPVGTEPQAKEASFRRTGAHQYGETRRYEALALITLMPYLQGMILYVLAVIYPFFCLMLLLPGQAGSFFIWMALWAWAKSWDVGWALVMVADEVLWELMPKTAFYNAQAAIDGNNAVSMLQIAFDGDPSYNTATYWLLLSGMVSGVPVITANMILGAKKAVSGVMLSNFTALADPFASGAADWAAGGQGRVYTTKRELAGSGDMQRKSIQGQTQMMRDNKILNDQAKGVGDELSKTMKQGDANSDQQEKARLEGQIGALKEGLGQDNQPEPEGGNP